MCGSSIYDLRTAKMSNISPLLIISYDVEERLSLSALAGSLGYPDAQIIVGGINEAINALNTRITSPDYLIIDIGDRGSAVFGDLDELALHCDPKVRVVVIGLTNDISFYRELRTRGIAEYCTRPANVIELRTALFQSSPTNNLATSSANAKKGTVISCMSAASGDGSSTFAVNVAYCLAEEFNQPTVLIDMDYQFGLVAKSLDLTAPFGIRELFDYPERGVDELLVEKMQIRYGRNLSIIAAPNELRQLPSVRPELIRDLIALLRARFAFVIVDIPHIWTGWTAASLTYSDQVVMVAQLWLRSLTHCSRLLAAWQTIGLTNNSISLIINRSGAKFKEAITAQDFERVSRHKIAAYLSNDIKAVVGAETQGKTLFETAQNTPLQQQIRQFAQTIMTNRNNDRQSSESGVSNDSKKNLLTFLGKKK